MRWFTFAILAYVALAVQTGIDSFVRLQAAGSVLAELNIVLVVVVFLAVYAPRQQALLACFVLGALQDLVTQQPFGLFALSYGLVALVITGMSQAVHRGHPLTHFTFTLAGGVVTAFVLIVHGWIHPPAHVAVAANLSTPPLKQSSMLFFTSTLYTAIVAPFAIALLHRLKRPLGFNSFRARFRSQ